MARPKGHPEQHPLGFARWRFQSLVPCILSGNGRVLSAIAHALHVALAGTWLGGVVFTALVVSPALKTMKWSVAERVRVRSVIGRRYARVGGVNLVLLLVFAIMDGLTAGFGTSFYVEYALLLVLIGLVTAHGAYFGRKLANLAEAEREVESREAAASLVNQRQTLQSVSSKISWANLMVSLVVVILAVNV